MLQRDTTEGGSRQFRIEAYDVAHLGGAQTVGVMTVLIDGEPGDGGVPRVHCPLGETGRRHRRA